MFSLPKIATAPFCPSEVEGSITIPKHLSFWRKWWLVAGPALLISVGYMDPGNWATDIAAGTGFGYQLLSIILLSNLAAIFLQSLAVRVGIVSGQDLAQLSRAHFPHAVNIALWLFAELAIIACDVAEVLGAGLALHLLFGFSLVTGILITILDTALVLGLKGRGFRQVEAIVLALVLTIGACFAIEMCFAGADWHAVLINLVPSMQAVAGKERLFLAIGIVGATVMPHNLYLHSSIVQTRSHAPEATAEAIRLNLVDTSLALTLAFFVNAAILILAAAAFHGRHDVTGISDAYHLLAPALGTTAAMIFFGVALLASGQSATFTGTIAGQIILEGYLNLKIPCWQRRVITRALALVPALTGVIWLGDDGVNRMLVISQVVLGLQLPFVIFPLLRFASSRPLLDHHRIGPFWQLVGWAVFAVITAANLWLVYALLCD